MSRPVRQNRNAEVDVRGEKRSNATHASTTDPDARLSRKYPRTGAMLCLIDPALMANRTGLVVQAHLTRADVYTEGRAAKKMIRADFRASTRQLTLGADQGSQPLRLQPVGWKWSWMRWARAAEMPSTA